VEASLWVKRVTKQKVDVPWGLENGREKRNLWGKSRESTFGASKNGYRNHKEERELPSVEDKMPEEPTTKSILNAVGKRRQSKSANRVSRSTMCAIKEASQTNVCANELSFKSNKRMQPGVSG